MACSGRYATKSFVRVCGYENIILAYLRHYITACINTHMVEVP